MGARSKGTRVFILVIVAVFFLTSVAFTGAVIYDEIKKNDAADATAELQKQLEEQTKNSEPEKKEDTSVTKLEGTKLANFTPIDKVDSLQKIDTKVGEGEEVKPGDTVTAHYTGALAKDGTIFQSSYDSGQPIPFSLNGVIKGWTEGVPGMKVGGERRLIIPAEMAYGNQSPSANIPANSDLVFDIVLVKIGE